MGLDRTSDSCDVLLMFLFWSMLEQTPPPVSRTSKPPRESEPPMRTFLISYDLAKPHRNKHILAQAIMSLGHSWARPLDSTWYLRAECASEDEILEKLEPLLDSDEDGLLVQPVNDDAVLTNASVRWFRQRRAALEIEPQANVLVFPAAAAPIAPMQSELPLRQQAAR